LIHLLQHMVCVYNSDQSKRFFRSERMALIFYGVFSLYAVSPKKLSTAHFHAYIFAFRSRWPFHWLPLFNPPSCIFSVITHSCDVRDTSS
jgi:hypothetical protein